MSVVPVSVLSHQQQAMSHGAAMARIALPVRGLSNPNPLSFHGFSRSAFLNRSSLRHGRTPAAPLLARRLCAVAHLDQIPGADMIHTHLDVAQHLVGNLKGSVMMLADAAAVSVDGAVDKAVEATEVVKQGSDGWLGGLTDTLERILIFLKDGLSMLHVPYAYGFAIILLTLLVKAATYPLTKSQVESTIAMQNLQPKLKAIQTRYQGDQERIQLETARLYKTAGVNPLAGCLPTLATLPVWIGLYRALSNVANEGLLTEGFFWIPSLAGPTTIAARSGGSGVAWLYPFTDGAPPLGWSDTIAYLVLPVLLVLSQFVSMQIMQPPQTDPSQKNTQIILKFLPLMIGYFSLSVPSGLSLYWLTNNILSTSQQVWLRRLQPAAAGAASDTTIITAGQAKRSAPTTLIPPADTSVSSPKQTRSFKEDRRGEKFRELKQKEAQRKSKKDAEAKAEKEAQISRNGSAELDDSEEDSIIDVSNESGEGVGVDTNGSGPGLASGPKRGKRSKRTRAE